MGKEAVANAYSFRAILEIGTPLLQRCKRLYFHYHLMITPYFMHFHMRALFQKCLKKRQFSMHNAFYFMVGIFMGTIQFLFPVMATSSRHYFKQPGIILRIIIFDMKQLSIIAKFDHMIVPAH